MTQSYFQDTKEFSKAMDTATGKVTPPTGEFNPKFFIEVVLEELEEFSRDNVQDLTTFRNALARHAEAATFKIIKYNKGEAKPVEDKALEITHKVDAVLDLVYFALNAIARTGLDADPIWKLVQEANMTKFTLPGGYVHSETSKWIKPPAFVAPDEDIKKEVLRQLSALDVSLA